MISWRYYWTNISDVVNKELHPHLLLVRQKRLLHGVHELRKAGPPAGKDPEGERCRPISAWCMRDAPHAIGPGRHTDADGWIKLATEFWEEQCK